VTSLRRLFETTLARLAVVGADPDDDEDTRLRKALLVLIAVLILPIALVWWVLYTAMGTWTGNIALAYALVSIGSILLFARTRNFPLLLKIQLAAIAISPTISMLPNGGFLSTGGVGIWGIMAPMGALVFEGTRSGVRWSRSSPSSPSSVRTPWPPCVSSSSGRRACSSTSCPARSPSG
jgi:hypothetical protein